MSQHLGSADTASPAQTTLVSILNWNGIDDTLDCLAGIDRGDPAAGRFRFLVLDNGSHDDPTARLRQQHPDVEVIRLPANLGFTGGHNHVLELCLGRGYHSMLMLNNDCEISIASIAALREMMDSQPQAAAVSSLVYRSGADRRALMVAGHIDWQQHTSVRPSNPDAVQPPGTPTLLVGTSVLLRCAAMQLIGLLDDRYFAYYDDNDLSARIHAAGWQAVYCPRSICLHDYKTLHGHSRMALYLLARNRWLFWRTHTPAPCRRRLTRDLLAQSLHDIALLIKHDAGTDKINAMIAGCWDAWQCRFGPPPARLHSPWWLRRLATLAPYFSSQLLLSPRAALRRRTTA